MCRFLKYGRLNFWKPQGLSRSLRELHCMLYSDTQLTIEGVPLWAYFIQENGRSGNTCDEIIRSFTFRCNKAEQTVASSLELRRVTSLPGYMQVLNRNRKPADVSVLMQDHTENPWRSILHISDSKNLKLCTEMWILFMPHIRILRLRPDIAGIRDRT